MSKTENDWIRPSTAAKLRGVKRQAIYYHIGEGHLKVKEMDGPSLYVYKPQILKYPFREPNNNRDETSLNN